MEHSSLQKGLRDNRRLLKLVLANNEIGNQGASDLAVALEDNCTLKTLALNGNCIGADGVKSLAGAIGGSGNTTLSTLWLHSMDIFVMTVWNSWQKLCAGSTMPSRY